MRISITPFDYRANHPAYQFNFPFVEYVRRFYDLNTFCDGDCIGKILSLSVGQIRPLNISRCSSVNRISVTGKAGVIPPAVNMRLRLIPFGVRLPN